MTNFNHSHPDQGISKNELSRAESDAQRYRILKDYLLRNGFIHHVALSLEESEPFVLGDTFYAQTFEDAVDTLNP
jgi:hypothetical protein